MKLILILVLLFSLAAGLAGQRIPSSLADGSYVLLSATTAPGGMAEGGGYTINVAVGQSEAGLQTGGAYEMGGGFWGGGQVTEAVPISNLFLPILLK